MNFDLKSNIKSWATTLVLVIAIIVLSFGQDRFNIYLAGGAVGFWLGWGYMLVCVWYFYERKR